MALQNPRIRKKLEALTGVVRSSEAEDVKIEQIIKHLREVDGDPSFKDDIKFDFPSDSQDMWFNCSPLSLERDLKGKIVVFDFFTYCCVNCLHILPDLARLEEKYPISSGLVVVGVHSAKFTNEKLSDNIKNAILRYDITHPVVNDPDVKLWDHLAITCWPTLVMFGPEGQLLYSIIGEGHESELLSVVDQTMQFYRDAGRLSTIPLPVALLKDAMPVSRLRFPGKVFVDSDKLFISDSGHHRILEVSLPAGRVVKVMGSGKPGLQDGPSSSACFNSPQGLVTHDGHLYVADTENHAIRAIDLKTYIVSTIVGNGSQGNDKEGGRMGTAQVISSPWDVTLGCSAESESPNLLFIAMSGIHQIWVYFLSKTKWLQGVEYDAGVCVRFCGSGEELNKYNSYPHKAGFAQPSGLAVGDGGFMYVADSESSTVRTVKLDTGSVLRCVGGGLDPTDLFAYGDQDGAGRDVRLQHPLGVAWDGGRRALYVVDSYNHKVKVVDVSKKMCKTLTGNGNAGKRDGSFAEATFSEPGGLCVSRGGSNVYIADTNNHCIRVLDMGTESVQELVLHFGEEETKGENVAGITSETRPTKRLTKKEPVEQHVVVLSGRVSVSVNLELDQSHHLTEGAPSRWQLWTESSNVSPSAYSGGIQAKEDVKFDVTVDVAEEEPKIDLLVEGIVFFCDNEGTCRSETFAVRISVEYNPAAPLKECLKISHQIYL